MSEKDVEKQKSLLKNFWQKFFSKGKKKTPEIIGIGGLTIDFIKLEELLGYKISNRKLFLEALLHRSFLPFAGQGWQSNERLEFVGDSILNFLVAEHLFHSHPLIEEGELTKLRARLVNRRVLAQQAKSIQLPEFLFLSPSAHQSLGAGSESILSDAFEAIIAAIYYDGGLEYARNFVHHSLLSHQVVIQSALMDNNFKSALLEITQSQGIGIPRYVTVSEEGPDHDRRFTVEVSIGQTVMGVGVGKSKKEAEQSSAEQALLKLQSLDSNNTIEK